MTDTRFITAARTLDEIKVEGKPLGRHVFHDARSKDHPADEAPQIVSVAHHGHGLPLDQGSVGKCTAEALAGALNSDPDHKPHHRLLTDKNTDVIYETETQLEGHPWVPTAPTQNDIGGSGLMVCKAGVKLGLISRYTHTFSLDSMLKALVIRPVMLGTNWYEGFDQPDPDGTVRIAGSIRGGHEVVALGIDTAADRPSSARWVWFANSWGNNWGVRCNPLKLHAGAFRMSFDTLDQLLHNEGDCAVPIP